MALTGVALLVLLLNVPFGYWRANVDRLGWQWFLAIHLPVPFVIECRLMAGVYLTLWTVPVLVCAYFAGQYAGAWIHHSRGNRGFVPVTSCLVWDLIRAGLHG